MHLIASLVGAVVILAMWASPAIAAPLSSLQWKNRVVLVFGADVNRVDAEIGRLARAASELDERDMVVIAIEEEARVAHGDAGQLDAAQLRRAYGIAEDTPFTVILVGKDGGEKLRRTGPLDPAELFGTIDAMPMRRSEAKD